MKININEGSSRTDKILYNIMVLLEKIAYKDIYNMKRKELLAAVKEKGVKGSKLTDDELREILKGTEE